MIFPTGPTDVIGAVRRSVRLHWTQRAARVTVTLRDGQMLEQFAPCRKGDPEAPLSDADLNDKFIELASPVIGDPAGRQLLDQLWRIEQQALGALRLTAL